MAKPSKAQMKVLEDLRNGCRLKSEGVGRYVMAHKRGFAWKVARETVYALLRMNLITQAGTLGSYWYTLTPAGLSALEDK